MAFQLVKTRKVWWPVTISVPQDGGTIAQMQCKAQFEILQQDEYDKLYNGKVADFLKRVVVDWDESIQDEQGHPLPFDEQAASDLFSIPYARQGFVDAYHVACAGMEDENLKKPPSTGQTAAKRKTRKRK